MFTFFEDRDCSVKVADLHQQWNNHVLLAHALPLCWILKEDPTHRARTTGLKEFFYSFKKEEDLGSSNINMLLLQLGQRMRVVHGNYS